MAGPRREGVQTVLGRLLSAVVRDTTLSSDPVPQPTPPESKRRLVGGPYRLERASVVRAATVAVLSATDRPPQLRLPGEQLRPRLRSSRHPLDVLVVNTAPVHLDVTAVDLLTLDGVRLPRLVVRLQVQLDDTNTYATLLDLVAERGADIEGYLLARVRDEVVREVQAAIRMNRLPDLRRLGLPDVLQRWLPPSFADGALLRSGFTVDEVEWPASDGSAP